MNWIDILNDSDEWSGMRVDGNEDIFPKFQLESGINCRFKLYNQKQAILWGTFGSEYWGVWVLNNKMDWELSDMPVSPINAPNVEKSKKSMYYKYWARFFTKELSSEKSGFLSKGLWTITIGSSLENKTENASEFINNSDTVFDRENPRWVEWDFGRGGSLIALKEKPRTDNGRVKWFRKLLRENSCPPVLIWYLSCIDGYVVLDGHCRLMAFQLESSPVKFLILNSVREEEETKDPKIQKNILLSLEKRQSHPIKPKMNVEEVNRLLISAFDTRPYYRPITNAKARRDYEKKWTKEVRELGLTKNIESNKIEDMIKRIEY
ncbi:hypothetical protein FORMB_17640 [Formosa sp. Hel1_33_131]|uniref:hypothetical protein n=1 Tax=Formosa sp. Hel1_33_131 TaxID=1336794 RepID=UPI00084E366D|nr:hypothetical protein [Formosa sp. Hel1_33_131]AOR28798.1 hypothetical protein FORMB_17640 [Formosa sp. Hel1_33_131]